MTRRRLFSLSLAPLFAPLVAWMPGRRTEHKTSLDHQIIEAVEPFDVVRRSPLEGWRYYTLEDDGVTPRTLTKITVYRTGGSSA